MGKYIDITPTIENLNAAIIKIGNDISRAIQMDNGYLVNLMLVNRVSLVNTRYELCKLMRMGYDTASRTAFYECMDGYVRDYEKAGHALYADAHKSICSMIKYDTKTFVERKTIFE